MLSQARPTLKRPHIGRKVGIIETRAHIDEAAGNDPDNAIMTQLDRDHEIDRLKTDDSN